MYKGVSRKFSGVSNEAQRNFKTVTRKSPDLGPGTRPTPFGKSPKTINNKGWCFLWPLCPLAEGGHFASRKRAYINRSLNTVAGDRY